MFTIGNYVFLGFLALTLIVISIGIGVSTDSIALGISSGVVSIAIFIGAIFGINWYNSSTASGIRAYKDYQSNMSNGIEREITITAEDGREIFHYKGKVDVESDHTDNYIKFESEEGKRYLIYYGITDTIIIKES
jgi:hypothetical protein